MSLRRLLPGAALVVILCGCSPTAATSSPEVTATASAPPSTAAGTVTAATSSPAPSGTPPATACAAGPKEHVYHPDRLRNLAPCVTVSGTIDLIRHEPDGDDHVLLRLDPGQLCAGQDCLNAENASKQRGDLVLEPVCEHTVTQQDAVAACEGFHNPLVVPKVGTHASVTGPWVLDLEHGWNEIHPVESFGA